MPPSPLPPPHAASAVNRSPADPSEADRHSDDVIASSACWPNGAVGAQFPSSCVRAPQARIGNHNIHRAGVDSPSDGLGIHRAKLGVSKLRRKDSLLVNRGLRTTNAYVARDDTGMPSETRVGVHLRAALVAVAASVTDSRLSPRGDQDEIGYP